MISEAVIISVTLGFPSVIVPVLSSATTLIFPVFSKACEVLNKIPFLAPIPFPTMIATGVARPRAHGHEITSTVIAFSSAKKISFPLKIQAAITITDISITAGTNIPDTISAILAIGALVAAASLTICMIFENVVSSPTLAAFASKNPELLMVAALILSPTVLSTGTDSPVSADSSIAELPFIIIPSTGIDSPGRTMNISPILTSSIATSFLSPSTRRVAVFGAIFISFFKASVVLPLDNDSSTLPTVISAGIIAADSKYSLSW